MYRSYEDPCKLMRLIEQKKAVLATMDEDTEIYNDYLQELASLEERLDHAWEDDEYDCNYVIAY